MQPKTYHGYGASETQGGYYGRGYYAQRAWYDAAGLKDLTATMDAYDSLRRKLAREGGSVGDLRALSDLLTRSICVGGAYGTAEAKLNKPESVKKALTCAGQYDVHYEIRRLDSGLPAYYLSRMSRDWWGTYGLLVEDIYRSEDFAIEDPRFVKLMTGGRGEYFLRLAPFREKVAQIPNMTKSSTIDAFFYTLGRNILQGAWHVDQRFSFMVADAFEVPMLKAAIELIYTVLSIDLHVLRRQLNENLLRFFEDVYPNEALVQLMRILPALKDDQFAALSRGASDAYMAISEQFNRFLRTDVPWRMVETGHMPLWKLLLANVKRLDMVARQTADLRELCDARECLQNGAKACVECLLSV